MNRLAQQLRLSLITESTRFLSLKLSYFSLSTFRLCKSLARSFFLKTLALVPSLMDDDLFSTADDNFLDLEFSSASTSNHSYRYFLDDDDNGVDKLYLVPCSWWRETQIGANETGVLYDVSVSNDDDDMEIVLDLREIEDSRKSSNAAEGFSGQECALVSGTMWLQALKWHNDSKKAVKDVHHPFLSEDDLEDVFPLQIRLSVSWETNSLVVKISLKDNMIAFYRKACDIFVSKAEQVHIWDFSGQTTQFVNERINLPNGSMGQFAEEILLELQVHGFSDSKNSRDESADEMIEHDRKDSSFSSGSVKMNGTSDYMNSFSMPKNSPVSGYGYRRVRFLGLTGLQNLGNTCFMNSAIQCLAHTPKLVDYFLRDYRKEINRENPLGMNGELALAFGDLLRKLWAPGASPVAPRMFKLKLAKFAPQFSGYNQHDSQEFLSFLLDGLHEDLNHVKCKPYIEVKDADNRSDKEVADEYWQNHLARNDSIIVDLYQIYKNKIFRFLEEPSDSLALIRDDDNLVAYQLPKVNEASPLVVFMHELMDRPSVLERAAPNWKLFGIPLVARLSDLSNGFDLRRKYLKLLNPFLMPADDVLNDGDESGITANEDSAMEDVPSPNVSDSNADSDGETNSDPPFSTDFQFCIKDDHGGLTEIKMNKPLPVPNNNRLEVHVLWSEKMVERYDTYVLSSLPEVFKSQFCARRPQESVSLYKCLEAFLKEEPLGPEDMWYCPSCKRPRQASKKLDLWRLPEILVVHLKRFSYSRIIKNKLETYVDFPVEDFDLSTYMAHKDGQFSNRYELYAISNHYGGMGGGHYTAFVDHGHCRWYEFDDENVSSVSEDRIKTSAAYVLFYKRVT
ncbi:ubiquitin carboxyl-terminal hydrolase 8 isoform X2 [Hevea brasiliensis]|uniref:ubiquitin carboxyl-terminal hydrolase 8 isoform X2 n=1 Tax=Hevea brasiliensis TaxID=3981 RepID=UPI0025E7A779|nr:ubiquitin carboxyl-terminal hydrolase 8 isoform X2 [Hevea brasiliensis]